MARARTDAAERTAQNKALVAQVSAEVGEQVSVRAAQRQRRAKKATPIPEGVSYRVKDRVLEYDDAELRPLGEILAGVVDYRVLGDNYAQLALRTTGDEFAHTLVDASLISKARPLLIKLYELVPKAGGNGGA